MTGSKKLLAVVNTLYIGRYLIMQSQLVCSGCRTLLLYPRGATNVRCAMCNTITSVPPPGMDVSQLVCAGCRTLLMYPRGATSVRCSCCNTINLVREATNQVAQVECGRCHTMLMYPHGAPSVKCAVCHFITNVGISATPVPFPTHGTYGPMPTPAHPTTHGTYGPMPTPAHPTTMSSQTHNQTVVVENPMSMDESGKLVSNVVVGVTTGKNDDAVVTFWFVDTRDGIFVVERSICGKYWFRCSHFELHWISDGSIQTTRTL